MDSQNPSILSFQLLMQDRPRQAASSLCLTPNLPQALRENPGLSIWEKEKASI
jgi:hypothetical protein